MMKKFDKSKTVDKGYRPIYANNMSTMVNLKATVDNMKALHGFCVYNSLPSGRIAKLQGGYYILNKEYRWELIAGSLNQLTFEVLYTKLINLTTKNESNEFQ